MIDSPHAYNNLTTPLFYSAEGTNDFILVLLALFAKPLTSLVKNVIKVVIAKRHTQRTDALPAVKTENSSNRVVNSYMAGVHIGVFERLYL